MRPDAATESKGSSVASGTFPMEVQTRERTRTLSYVSSIVFNLAAMKGIYHVTCLGCWPPGASSSLLVITCNGTGSQIPRLASFPLHSLSAFIILFPHPLSCPCPPSASTSRQETSRARQESSLRVLGFHLHRPFCAISPSPFEPGDSRHSRQIRDESRFGIHRKPSALHH